MANSETIANPEPTLGLKGRFNDLWPYALVTLGALVWLWPIGIGGAMPVGGDVTRFSLGLMAFLRESLGQGRLPYWNDLWGYGFPGIAESQMGVYYPPHWVLYGLMPLETAYTASLVLHSIWAACGAVWAARCFGISKLGRVVVGVSFAFSGWFLIHLPHQWGATTGSWMPWAWGLAWKVTGKGDQERKGWGWLPVVLTLQILPGHFQLGFITEVGVLLIGLYRLTVRDIRSALVIGFALAVMIPLGAAQLWPTLELAQLAANRRDYDYLSAFASPPSHFLSLITPRLFHESPLWRPIIWDAFHAMPEEHLPYIGLAPLFLAMIAVRQARRNSEVRFLVGLAGVMALLAFGPYVPIFAQLIKLPGFSFFRAPARWGLGFLFALSLLSGKGFDLILSEPRFRVAIRWFVLWAAIVVSLAILAFELAIWATDRTGIPIVLQLAQQVGKLSPWSSSDPLPVVMAHARRAQTDLRVQAALAKQGKFDPRFRNVRLIDERWLIYRDELMLSGALLILLLVFSFGIKNPRRMQNALVVLAFVDLCSLSRARSIDVAPVGNLAVQSPVVAKLSRLPRGTRSIDQMGNLAMVAGVAPVLAYRTLDLPAMPGLSTIVRSPLTQAEAANAAPVMELMGAGVRILDPFELADFEAKGKTPAGWKSLEVIRDPQLAGWLFGVDLIQQLGERATRFGWLEPVNAPLAYRHMPADTPQDEFGLVVRSANSNLEKPKIVAESPEEVEVTGRSPLPILAAVLYHPQWQVFSDGGRTYPPREFSTRWTAFDSVEGAKLTLRYVPKSERIGLLVSIVAWSIWLAVVVVAETRRLLHGILGKR